MMSTYRYGDCIAQLMQIEPQRWLLTHIGVPPVTGSRGKGYGELCLSNLTTIADAEGVELVLSFQPDPDMDPVRLRQWYRRHGFVDRPELDQFVMTREPQ